MQYFYVTQIKASQCSIVHTVTSFLTHLVLFCIFSSVLFRPSRTKIIFIMFKLAAFAALLGSAAAFAPAQSGRTATSLAVNELEIGTTAPLGVYDPLGWLDTEPEAFERRRAVERKHGRVAMAAVVGSIIHHNDIEFDGYLSPSQNLKFSDVPNGVDGIRSIPTAGLLQILFFFALVELQRLLFC